MIRLSTCATVLLAFGSGLYLYQTKHQAQVLDRQIEHTVKVTAATRAQARELAAAWTLLGSPDRLQQLSDQFLGIKAVLPSQFVAMSDLDARLPAPRTLDAPSPDAPGDTGPDMPPIATAEPVAVPSTAHAAAQPATPSGVQSGVQSSPSATAAPTAPQGRAVESTKTAPAVATRPIDRKPVETPQPAHDVAQARPTVSHPVSPPPQIAELERPARPVAQRLAPAPSGGSLLGMARTVVPAPVPLPVSTAPMPANSN